MERMNTTADVARILNMSVDVVRRKMRDGSLPGVKVGNKWLVSNSALASFLGCGVNENHAR